MAYSNTPFTPDPDWLEQQALRASVWEKTRGQCWYCGTLVLLKDVKKARFNARVGFPHSVTSDEFGYIINPSRGAPFRATDASLEAEMMSMHRDPQMMDIDHQIPRKQGGSDDLSNLFPCCRSCNSSKGTKSLEEYRIHLRRKNSIPAFTAKQKAYLKKVYGIVPTKELPSPPIVFWGEKTRRILPRA